MVRLRHLIDLELMKLEERKGNVESEEDVDILNPEFLKKLGEKVEVFEVE